MTEETPAKRGEAAWKEQKDSIAQRNADAHKRAQGAKRSRATQAAAVARDDADREAKQLRDLNARLAKQQARAAR
jgi:hypothetical protein